ncbi:MAG: hypothetical protein Q7T25_09775 [Sideroxyarcus sp.]|nr:hypothetical protein [Sideroxyarcus sp.]
MLDSDRKKVFWYRKHVNRQAFSAAILNAHYQAVEQRACPGNLVSHRKKEFVGG